MFIDYEKCMRASLLALIFAVFFGVVANAGPDDPGIVALQAALLHCIAPIAVGDDVARSAEQSKLPELPYTSASQFLPNGGRAFEVPDASGEVVLMVSPEGMCSVAVRTLDVPHFWTEIDHWFGPGTPWKSVRADELPRGIVKSYEATINGRPILGLISAAEKPVDQGMQALITISRLAP